MAPSWSDSRVVGNDQVGVDLGAGAQPVQAGQAPCGLLKEKVRGSSSSKEWPQTGQARCSLKVSVGPSRVSTRRQTPCPGCSAVSSESVSRLLDVRLAHQPVDDDLDGVLDFWSSSISSVSSVISPSTRARMKPALARSARRSSCSPLRPGPPAPARWNRVPSAAPGSGRRSAAASACSTCLPQLGQCGIADPRVEQAQVVVDLGDGAHRRARVAAGGLLLDRDRRRQPLDVVDVGLLHLPEELAGVGGEALHVAALPLGVDGVEGQARFPDPEIPVKTINLSRGSSNETFFRLCSRAPRITSWSVDIARPRLTGANDKGGISTIFWPRQRLSVRVFSSLTSSRRRAAYSKRSSLAASCISSSRLRMSR